MTKKLRLILIIGFLIGLILAFLLGRVSKTNSQLSSNDILILSAQAIQKEAKEDESPVIRASSRGTKYYFPWCQSTFSEENTIYFESESEATKKGYELAQGCLKQ